MECLIDGISCATYLESDFEGKKCLVDLDFIFNFTNIGLACQDIMIIKVEIGPLGEKVIKFNDFYNHTERELCVNEEWMVQDKRLLVNVCEIEENSLWPIRTEIEEYFGQSANNSLSYKWEAVTAPSVSPTEYLCQDCTLAGVISGGKFL